ncbi:hypothetical protein [Legionella spiritensis]|uniref:hypothetical protein n=1 Tax=Legionella spiritensis TaxID=452 RepID=UPI000F71AF0E|nr:hypothetical protein [Legionella spiritensis]VEG91859.1 Leucine-rich repeat-and coiled coil-containing protein Substrate of the Dot/Icm secretion system [Legionella spiritensis]
MRVNFPISETKEPFLSILESALKNRDATDPVLDLSKERLGKRDIEELETMIRLLSTKLGSGLRVANLANTGLQLKPASELVKMVAAFEGTEISKLILSSNFLCKLPANEFKEVLMTVAKNSKITDIDLSSNGLSAYGIETLKSILPLLNQPHIDKVWLGGNRFDKAAGAYEMADLLYDALGSRAMLEDTDEFSQTMARQIAQRSQANDQKTPRLVVTDKATLLSQEESERPVNSLKAF